ncbi:hypothetical protein PCL_07397 [Purpureocillium lilacinum]|uniref:Uncharacterized protein n=1 Tax=Purpureocillium lilacinum TaxID=33203 RepID=A0A2U3DS68_PURLI|nr:hypothetical protein PCL_07397 [Purpureocillium lilacinum]
MSGPKALANYGFRKEVTLLLDARNAAQLFKFNEVHRRPGLPNPVDRFMLPCLRGAPPLAGDRTLDPLCCPGRRATELEVQSFLVEGSVACELFAPDECLGAGTSQVRRLCNFGPSVVPELWFEAPRLSPRGPNGLQGLDSTKEVQHEAFGIQSSDNGYHARRRMAERLVAWGRTAACSNSLTSGSGIAPLLQLSERTQSSGQKASSAKGCQSATPVARLRGPDPPFLFKSRNRL